MALLKLGPMVAQASGSIGGTVFARNAAGPYARARGKPVWPGLLKQRVITERHSNLVTYWHDGLTVAERAPWNAKAKASPVKNRLGDSNTMSGFNLFIRANMLLLLAGKPQVDVPPGVIAIAEPNFTLAHTPATGIQVTSWGAWAGLDPGRILAFASAPVAQSKNFFKGPFAVMYNFNAPTFTVPPPQTVIPSASLTINTRTFIKWVLVADDGAVSTPTINYCDVGAVA